MFWMPDQVRHDESGTFYDFIKVEANPLSRQLIRTGRIAERRHTAISTHTNSIMGYLKALDAEEKRFALSGLSVQK